MSLARVSSLFRLDSLKCLSILSVQSTTVFFCYKTPTTCTSFLSLHYIIKSSLLGKRQVIWHGLYIEDLSNHLCTSSLLWSIPWWKAPLLVTWTLCTIIVKQGHQKTRIMKDEMGGVLIHKVSQDVFRSITLEQLKAFARSEPWHVRCIGSWRQYWRTEEPMIRHM